MAQALVWFSQNPWPPRGGAHQRCLSMLTALREMGYRTTLLSSELAHYPWSQASKVELESRYVDEVRLYHLPWWDWRLRGAEYRLVMARFRLTGATPGIRSWRDTPPGYRRWCRAQALDVAPSLLLSSYAQFDPLVPHRDFARIPRLIDSIDVVSASKSMWAKLSVPLTARTPLHSHDVPPEVLERSYLEGLPEDALGEEFAIYDRYTDTIAISPLEADLIRAHTSSTSVHHVPMTVEVSHHERNHEGAPLFVGGANPFNLQGLIWFAERVLPRILQEAPDFELDVVGELFADWRAPPAINLRGYVSDLEPLYARAGFTICPLLAGTGQQVKIVHAMANGLSVVATPGPSASSPLEDGVSGFVADSPEHFAQAVLTLWRQPGLRRQFGEAARDTIERECSPARLQRDLARILHASA